MSADEYATWRKLVAGGKVEINADNPQPGFYRWRPAKGEPFLPVAIWRDPAGALKCLVRDKEESEQWAQSQWHWFATNAIAHELYQAVMGGAEWPDVAPEVADLERSRIGGNNPPDDDTAQGILDQIQTLAEALKAYKKIASDEDFTKAQTLRSAFLELSGKADKRREALKRPHLDAGTAIDNEWRPAITSGKKYADDLRAAMKAFENERLAKQRAEEARIAEARRQIEAEQRLAEVEGRPQPKAPDLPPEPAPLPESRTVKGASGRAASTRLVMVPRIVDYDKAYSFLKTHPEMIELIGTLIKRAVKSGKYPEGIPGVEMVEEADVR
jgi:hypothetical protein